MVALEKYERTDPDIIVIPTLLALTSGPGNTPLARVVLRDVRKMLGNNDEIDSRSVEPIWCDVLVRNMKLAHRTKYG